MTKATFTSLLPPRPHPRQTFPRPTSGKRTGSISAASNSTSDLWLPTPKHVEQIMTPPPEPDPSSSDAIRFRPSKKRKVYRQRDDPSPINPPSTHVDAPATSEKNLDVNRNEDDDESAVAAALKLRNARRVRQGGVAFTASARGEHDQQSSEQSLVPAAQASAAAQSASELPLVHGITDRFTQERSLVSSMTTKYMTEYIESRLSRRNNEPASSRDDDPDQSTSASHAGTAAATQPTGAGQSTAGSEQLQQTAAQGKLMEVDLDGIQTSYRNAAQQNRQRGADRKKPRLGPDGKPWRGRKRRGSDDIKRDQLVEEFLHENRLDVYDNTPDAETAGAEDDGTGTTADDRLAEQFRRQYMDDMARRRQKKKPAQQPPGRAAGPAEEVLKGPKLGGSRNARAAVRDALLKKERDGKK